MNKQKEFNLSEKMMFENDIPLNVFKVGDVKEFIRLLKEEIKNRMEIEEIGGDDSFGYLCSGIDKLAGDDLSSQNPKGVQGEGK